MTNPEFLQSACDAYSIPKPKFSRFANNLLSPPLEFDPLLPYKTPSHNLPLCPFTTRYPAFAPLFLLSFESADPFQNSPLTILTPSPFKFAKN